MLFQSECHHPHKGADSRAARGGSAPPARMREIRRIEILALHLHDDPVQSAVADYRQPRQLSRTVLEEGRARIGRQRVTGGKQRRHLFVGKTDGRHGEQPQDLRGGNLARWCAVTGTVALSPGPPDVSGAAFIHRQTVSGKRRSRHR